jgi:hypothetical protein
MPAPFLTGNPGIGYVHNASNPAGITPRTNWTERMDSGYATPVAGIEVMSRNNGETGSTISWGGTSLTAFSAGVIELDASTEASTYNETLAETVTVTPSLSTTGDFSVSLSETATPVFGSTDAEPIDVTLSESLTPSASFVASAPVNVNAFPMRAVQWSFNRADSILRSGWTGARTIVAAPWNAKWQAHVELATLQGEANMAAVKAWLGQRRGKLTPFRLYATTEAQNSNTGVTVSGSASQGATSLDLAGYSDQLLDGQFVTVNDQLLCLTEDQSGDTITFQPPLRQRAVAGREVETARPYAYVHLSTSNVGWQVGSARLFNVSFDCEEAAMENEGVVPTSSEFNETLAESATPATDFSIGLTADTTLFTADSDLITADEG